MAYRQWCLDCKQKRVLSVAAVLLFAFVALVRSPQAQGQMSPASYQIKASYIYNFLQFVSFPEASIKDGQITVCIVGENRFGPALRELDGAQTPQGTISVASFGRYKASMNLSRCHLLYVVESEKSAAPAILAKTKNSPMLTIGEFGSFIDQGGLIELVEHDDVVRFRIDKESVNKYDLKIDAQLIQLSLD